MPAELIEIPKAKLNKDAWPADGAYLIFFDDAERAPELFVRSGAREAAFERYSNVSVSWNAHLFVKIDSNCKATGEQVPDATPVGIADNLPAETLAEALQRRLGFANLLIVASAVVPDGEAHIYQNGRMVGRIINCKEIQG